MDTPPKRSFLRAYALGGLGMLLWNPAAPGLVLMLAAVAAFTWASSALGGLHQRILKRPLAFSIGDMGPKKTLILWINDGLMALFILMVGLEVKREVACGELSNLRIHHERVRGGVGLP